MAARVRRSLDRERLPDCVYGTEPTKRDSVAKICLKSLLFYWKLVFACTLNPHLPTLLRPATPPFVNICSCSRGVSAGYIRSECQWGKGGIWGLPGRACVRVKPAWSQACSPLFYADQVFSNCWGLKSAFVMWIVSTDIYCNSN